MQHLLKSAVIATTAFLFLTFASWLINSLIHSSEPADRVLASVVFFLSILPALVSGYIGGRLAAQHGLLIGFTSNIVSVLLMEISFFPFVFEMDVTVIFLGILISSLAGGVGELNAIQAKNA